LWTFCLTQIETEIRHSHVWYPQWCAGDRDATFRHLFLTTSSYNPLIWLYQIKKLLVLKCKRKFSTIMARATHNRPCILKLRNVYKVQTRLPPNKVSQRHSKVVNDVISCQRHLPEPNPLIFKRALPGGFYRPRRQSEISISWILQRAASIFSCRK
jgi:hypothetical protein